MNENQRHDLKQLFSYIRALAERRFGIVQRWSDYSFAMSLFDLPRHELCETPSFEEPPEGAQTDLILSIGKPEVPPCPELPESLLGWLEKGYDDPGRKPVPMDKHVTVDPEFPENAVTELFSDSEERRSDYERWSIEHEQWAQEALPAYRVRKTYEKLYELHSVLSREKDRLELIVGDGIFETQLEDGTKICHPVVLERVSLVFNANVPCFTISDSDAAPMLYSRLLRTIAGLEWSCLSDYAEQIDKELIHPFEVKRFNEFLASFCNSLSADCEFLPEGGNSKAKFSIKRGAVLFTRSRASGYSAMLDKIIDDIDVADDFSQSLLSIIGENGSAGSEVSLSDGAMEVNGISGDVLLEKAANREQLLIAKKIESNPAVLVQGPPGTGKTHTISNIIGDLLAKGQSVLVTSQTSKALSVLRDKISEPIRPLCVSVLDDNRKQLEQSLTTINEYMTSYNAESLESEAAKLLKERDGIIAELSAAKNELVELVGLEYSPIVVDGASYSPKEAAIIASDMPGDAYICDEVPVGTKLPLLEVELKSLYASNASLTAHEEALLASGAPDAQSLIPAKEMERICQIVKKTDDEIAAAGVELWKTGVKRDAEAVGKLCAELERQNEKLGSAEEWKLKLAQGGVGGHSANSIIESINKALPELRALAQELKLELVDTQPTIPGDLIGDDTERLMDEIYEELDSEKINWLTVALHPKWKQLLDRCIINGEKCDTRSELYTVKRYHHLLLGRKNLLRRWDSLVTAIGGPKLDSEQPEEQGALAWPTVFGWANWYTAEWKPLTAALAALGFDYQRFMERLPLEAKMEGEVKAARYALANGLCSSVSDEYLRGDRSECIRKLDMLSGTLLPFTEKYPELASLRSSVESRDGAAYTQAFDVWARICMKRETYARRVELLEKLAAVCPKWAAQIESRSGINGGAQLPEGLEKQWLRAQLCGALGERCTSRVSSLQDSIAKLNKQLSGVTRELIAKKAWAEQLRTMLDGSKKRALTTWAELVKRVGKGTGKRAEQLLASGELRKAMRECRRAVPVWIMPLSSVAEYFEPSEEKFDVLIIDEASQADLTSLISLYIAKKVIVVGDDKQVSPTPIGLDIETSQKLRQEFLDGIPGASMYDELVSIYDLGKANYEPITLKEHFRCADDIINFSNYYTYNGIIRPLRDSNSIKLKPATVALRVENGCQTGRKTNRMEAEMTAALIKACTEDPQYADSTIGVITMIGDEQAVIIDRMLRSMLTEAEYQKRQILCGNPSYFQGDERDVIFISLVDSSSESGKALTLRKEGYNELYAKRYNVAASRAKDQMWVIHSLDPENDLKADDIRLRLITHAANPSATAEALYNKTYRELSEMEKGVSEYLEALGYRMTSHQLVGNYTVALTCSGESGRVAIECDGDKKAVKEDIVEELNKQSVLERIGWRFIRLRASEYYRDKKTNLEELVKRLSAIGVTPNGKTECVYSDDLVDRITSRAKEILAERPDADEEAQPDEIEGLNEETVPEEVAPVQPTQ